MTAYSQARNWHPERPLMERGLWKVRGNGERDARDDKTLIWFECLATSHQLPEATYALSLFFFPPLLIWSWNAQCWHISPVFLVGLPPAHAAWLGGMDRNIKRSVKNGPWFGELAVELGHGANNQKTWNWFLAPSLTNWVTMKNVLKCFLYETGQIVIIIILPIRDLKDCY